MPTLYMSGDADFMVRYAWKSCCELERGMLEYE